MKNLWKQYKSLSKPVKASFWFLICGFLQRGISVISTPIFTRLLSTQEYGVYSVFSSWLEIITVFVTLKLGAGVYMQGLVKRDKDREVFTSSLLGLATTVTAGWFIIYLLFHDALNKLLGLSTTLMVCMFIMMWSTVAYNFWSARQRVEYEYHQLIAVAILVALAKPIFGIISVWLSKQNKAEARIISLAAIELIAYLWMYIKLVRSGKVFYHKQNWSYALRFNIPLIPHYLSQTILNHSDRIMIKAISGISSAGVYSLAYNISTIMIIFNTAVNNTLNPWIYQSIKKNKIHQIGRVSYALLIIIAGINLLLIALAPEVIAIFAPSAYYDAIWVIPPVAMAVYFRFTYCLFADFEFYFEKTKWVMYASLTGAILNIILNYIFLPRFGYVAAAYTTLFCYVLYSAMHYIFMYFTCKKFADNVQPYRLKILVLISGIFMGIGFGMMAFYKIWYVRYAFALSCFAVVFVKRKSILILLTEIRKAKR